MRKIFLLIIILFCGYSSAFAQLSGTSLMEYQYGQLPTANESSFNALYNKINLNYRYQNLKIKAGVQYFVSPYSERNYAEPGWLGLNYKNKGWEFNAGNFNETLGRGILLRSYEIQGAIIEDLSYRSKQYFYRDLLGASASYRAKSYSIKALWGYSLNNLNAPTQDWNQRRDNEIAALTADYRLLKQTIGGTFMSVKSNDSNSDYAMATLNGRLFPFLNYYSAYASTINSSSVGHALYTSFNFSFNKLGLSLELKDYDNFLIGSGINEPPALIKEHSYRVLNRSTHVLQPENETGYQIEAYYQATDNTLITLNYTSANNHFGKTFKYREYFAEISTLIGSTDLKAFADYANDPFKDESDRLSLGVNIDQAIKDKHGLFMELEWQTFDRSNTTNQNYIGAATYRYNSKLFVSALSEFSNDNFITDDGKLWLSCTVRYKVNTKHSLQLFAGERRGGPACSAGVCYEVLDFKGVELRWNARF